jgi:DNA-directed RNA polymerase
LLLFKNGEVLTQNGLKSLKIYTSNAFGIDKLSINSRLEWVETHIDKIINAPENEF